jgi:DNA polymerase-1
MNDPIIIIDGPCLAHRAKHTTGQSLPGTGVVYGFFRQLVKIVEKIGKFSNIAFCWDSKRSFRKKEVATYKEHRHLEPPTKFDINCLNQFSQIRSIIIPKLFTNNFLISGYEADDLIASIVSNNEGHFKIVSQDQDLLQLLDTAQLFNPKTYTETSLESFLTDTDLTACQQWIEVKSLAGCSSDNVIGIPGIGEKTAIKYIKGNCSDAIKEKITKFRHSPEYVINKWLVSLPLAGTPHLKLKPYQKPDLSSFINFCTQYRIRTFSLKQWVTVFDMEEFE